MDDAFAQSLYNINMNFRRLRAFLTTWWQAAAYPLLLIVVWIICGRVLSLSYFDNGNFEWLKVLERDATLSFMSVVLAVQIPIFILFLEAMRNSGYIFKILLPTTTRFRETVAILLTCALLILLSPQESYLYTVVAVFLGINLYAIIQAFEVVFRMDSGYVWKVRSGLERLAKQSFRESLDDRIAANKAHEWVKKNNPKVKLEFFGSKTEGAFLVKSHREGYLKGIRRKYSNILIKMLAAIHGDIRVEILTLYGKSIKNGMDVVAVYSEKPIHRAWKRPIRHMVLVGDKSHYIATCERVFDDFESTLLEGVEKDNKRMVKETLDLYGSMTTTLDKLVQDDMVSKDSNYNLEQALNDVKGGDIFSYDSLSTILNKAYEVIEHATDKAIKHSHEETGKLLIGESYAKLYSSVSNNRKLAIARNEALQNAVLQRFVYDESLRKDMSDTQEILRKKILNFMQEGTRMIAWQVKEKDYGEAGRELLIKRIENLRKLAVDAYKKDLTDIYDGLLEVLLRLESRRDDYLDDDPELSHLVSTSLYMILAYMLQRDDLASSYAKKITDRLTRWPLGKLTEIAVGAVDSNLAHEWSFDTLDLRANVGVQQVPDFDAEIRKLWVILVSKHSVVPADTSQYGDEQMLGSTLFFTDGANADKDIGIYTYLDAISNSAKRDQVRAAIDTLVGFRFEEEHRAVADAALDEDKIRAYKEYVNLSFAESSDIIKIFNKPSKHYKESQQKAGSGYKEVAYNTVFDKEMFMKLKWHIGYSMEYQGSDIGENIARGLDRGVLPSLLNGAENIEKFTNLLERVKSYSGEWIVISNRVYGFESRQKLSAYVTDDSTYTEQRVKGIRQKLPIMMVNLEDLASGLYFIKRSEIGKIIHPKNDDGYVKVDIKSYSSNPDMLEQLLTASPDWLKEKGDLDAQRRFLLTQVRLYVAFIFKYEPCGKKTVLHYAIDEDF